MIAMIMTRGQQKPACFALMLCLLVLYIITIMKCNEKELVGGSSAANGVHASPPTMYSIFSAGYRRKTFHEVSHDQ